DENPLVRLTLNDLGPLAPGFQYSAWAQSGGRTVLLDRFDPGPDGDITLSRFALLQTLTDGDRIFVTIEPNVTPDPNTPSNTVVLSGIVSGDSATLVFPRLSDFANAVGFVTVTENGRQILAEYANLPDVSDLNFIYQGFLVRDGSFTPLRSFNANQVPVSDTVTFDATTAQYILTVRPVVGVATSTPYTIQPFFTNGTLLPLVRQQLVRSSLTPGVSGFRFPFGTATIRR
ncbi:MAG: hypothetical protein ACYC08_05715, partial [Armatimonadota bacterium]